MKAIGSPLDFVGLNVYTADYVRADGSPPRGYCDRALPGLVSAHGLALDLTSAPSASTGPCATSATSGIPRPFTSRRTAAPSADVVTPEGHIEDTDRVMYLRNHLTHLQRAAPEGFPVKGYFLWSLLDNFEWADGYSKRFGIYYVDFKTEQRTPKLSAEWYREVIARNTVV